MRRRCLLERCLHNEAVFSVRARGCGERACRENPGAGLKGNGHDPLERSSKRFADASMLHAFRQMSGVSAINTEARHSAGVLLSLLMMNDGHQKYHATLNNALASCASTPDGTVTPRSSNTVVNRSLS